jgi:hypothetical protein
MIENDSPLTLLNHQATARPPAATAFSITSKTGGGKKRKLSHLHQSPLSQNHTTPNTSANRYPPPAPEFFSKVTCFICDSFTGATVQKLKLAATPRCGEAERRNLSVFLGGPCNFCQSPVLSAKS